MCHELSTRRQPPLVPLRGTSCPRTPGRLRPGPAGRGASPKHPHYPQTAIIRDSEDLGLVCLRGPTPTPEFPATHICERESRGQLGRIPASVLRTSLRRFPPTPTDTKKQTRSESWSSRARRGEGGCGRGSSGTPAGPPRGRRRRRSREDARARGGPTPPPPAAAGREKGRLWSPSPAAGGRLPAPETDGWRHCPGTYRSRRRREARAALTSKPGSLLRSPKGP